MMKLKVYLLTTEGSERTRFQMSQLEKLTLVREYEIFYGHRFDDGYIDKHCDRRDKVWHYSIFSDQIGFLNRTISCADGHLRMLSSFLSDPRYEYGLFLEDDVEINDAVIAKLPAMVARWNRRHIWRISVDAVKRAESILHGHKAEKITSVDLKDIGKLYYGGCVGYVCDKIGGRYLFSNNSPIKGPSDVRMFSNCESYYNIVGTGLSVNVDFHRNSTIGDRRKSCKR